MIYVCSDIHGYYDSFLEFIHYVHFKQEDTLYIIGDVLDRGSMSIPLIRDIMQRDNVVLLKGNHEVMLLPILDDLTYKTKEE